MVFLCDDVFFTISQQDRAASDWAQLNVGDFRRLQSGLEGLSRDVSPIFRLKHPKIISS